MSSVYNLNFKSKLYWYFLAHLIYRLVLAYVSIWCSFAIDGIHFILSLCLNGGNRCCGCMLCAVERQIFLQSEAIQLSDIHSFGSRFLLVFFVSAIALAMTSLVLVCLSDIVFAVILKNPFHHNLKEYVLYASEFASSELLPFMFFTQRLLLSYHFAIKEGFMEGCRIVVFPNSLISPDLFRVITGVIPLCHSSVDA